MKVSVLLLSTFIATASCGRFINSYPRYKEFHDGGDPGQPLYLTPMIEKGDLEGARKAANVTAEQFSWVQSYSGYITVDKQYQSNLFFWYFPCETTIHAPVILWLQGGPGASSLFGLFTENGPFYLASGGKLVQRKYRWNQNHHVIYIDNPAGTGFSFTKDDKGYARNEKDVGKDLYAAITQIFKLFPVLQTLKFWITGESYAGKYVPALAYRIHIAKKRAIRLGKPEIVPIQLQGIAMGNGLSDPLHQLNYGDYLYQIGLIDTKGRTLFQQYESKGIKCIKSRDMECAFDVFDTLINMDESKNGSIFSNLTGYKNYYNYLKTQPEKLDQAMGVFLQSSDTRKAIHVGNNTFHDLEGENKVEEFLKKDVMDSVAPWIAELLSSYRVCVYNGQLDIIVAYPLTENYLKRLKFDGDALYKLAPRYIWKVDNEIAGYVKEAKNLIEILVRNAGHMAPADQPKWIFDMISRLTHGKQFNKVKV